jgi:hypothetical protein
MPFVTELLAKLGPWIWFIAAMLLFLLETVVPGVHFLWFGLAAAVVGVLTLATGLGWEMQLGAFVLTALATVFVVRHFAAGTGKQTDAPGLNERGLQLIGRIVEVEDAIVNGRGKVRVGDTVWAAQGEDAPRGARVEVTGSNGSVLVVAHPDRE